MYLHIKAPFAAFRPFQSGSFRSTTLIPSPSTIYGLLLNLAGIEQRTATDEAITKIKPKDELPQMEIAIAQVKPSDTAILSQQLHSYPVGNSGKELAKKTYGAKYWISPVRRQILIDLELIIGVKAEADFCDRIIKGLNGQLDEPRYGLPFAGDNNFLIDEINILNKPKLARWYSQKHANNESHPKWYGQIDNDSPPSHDKCRLTTWIDRANNTKTKTKIFGIESNADSKAKTKMSDFEPSNYLLEPPEDRNIWISLP
ncbi:MAG: CRISPR-associated protein Cas5 [Cyanobacteria bacterium P01_G01_bin.67]